MKLAVYKVKSKSQPASHWLVTDIVTELICNCLAFTYRRHCRHVEEVRQYLKHGVKRRKDKKAAKHLSMPGVRP